MNGNSKKIFSLLTICRKAGKITFGFDAAKISILEKKATVVIIASDVSEKTEKEVRFYAAKAAVPVIKADFTINEAEFGLGKRAGIFAICDGGFSERLKELIISDKA